jgi:arsenate reductase (thioredoxin)
MQMKFFSKLKDSGQSKQVVLFVCIENAGRSQMAERFFRKYSPEGYEPLSAGTRPVSSINPLAMEAMSEVGQRY